MKAPAPVTATAWMFRASGATDKATLMPSTPTLNTSAIAWARGAMAPLSRQSATAGPNSRLRSSQAASRGELLLKAKAAMRRSVEAIRHAMSGGRLGRVGGVSGVPGTSAVHGSSSSATSSASRLLATPGQRDRVRR